jgi:hypothetical protein
MNYVSTIANSMLAQTNNAILLGPEVYTAIAEWEKREIPATIVLKSIEEVSRQKENYADGLPVDLIQDAVLRNFQTWLAKGSGPRSNA